MAAVIGDLAASAIKRNNDIKDYGKLIPGHGGVLDRFDSIIFTAPMVYYCFTFLSCCSAVCFKADSVKLGCINEHQVFTRHNTKRHYD